MDKIATGVSKQQPRQVLLACCLTHSLHVSSTVQLRPWVVLKTVRKTSLDRTGRRQKLD